jgi:molybdopterin synthase catalytic subunit
VRLGEPAVDATELGTAVRGPQAGAVVVFLGTTRAGELDEGAVESLDYEAARPLADTELATIAGEAAQRFALTAIAVHHTLGRVPVGLVSLGVAVSAPHRAEAFAAAEWTVTAIKTRVPIWKRNILAGDDPRRGPWAEGTPVPH